MTDALGQQEIYTYSALDKPVSKTDRNGTVTSYTYDALGRPVSTVAGAIKYSEESQYTYTKTGQVRTEENTWQRTTYTYDELGRVVQVTEDERNLIPNTCEPVTYTVTLNPNGGTVTPNRVEVTVGGIYQLPRPSYSGYTFLGWYLGDTKISDGDIVRITENCTFTARWRKEIEIVRPVEPDRPIIMGQDEITPYSSSGPTDELISYVKTYSYDLSGNRTGFTLAKSGETVQNIAYAYDNLNRLSTVSEGGSVQAVYTYDANGNRASLTYANGTQETYTYNKANWITGLENRKGSETLSSFTYTYYASGNQRTETDHTGKVTGYMYDGLGRLTRETESSGAVVSYTYDRAGNRIRMKATGNNSCVANYTYDANNRLLEESKVTETKVITTTYTYDANGNMLSRTTTASAPNKIPQASDETYFYNGFNQLIGMTVSSTAVSTTITYAYNAQGIRTAKRVNGLRTAFLLDGGNVVAEVQNNTVTDNYLRGVNLIRREATNETEYYLFNAHGDVVTTTNLNGTINQEYDYDAFGNEKNPDALDSNHFRYCGEYLDFETGDYYLRARYYDPTIGRFTQQDTRWNTANMIYGDTPQKINAREDKLGLKSYTHVPQIMAVMQSGNLYVYCINNPIYYIDQTGNFISTLVGAATGATGGALTALFKGDNVAYGALAGLVGGAISGFALDIGLIVAAGSSGIATPFGIAISAAGAAFGSFVQSVMEQILNGTSVNDLDIKSALRSAGISGGFSLISFGLGTLVNNVFQLSYTGKTVINNLVLALKSAGIADTAVAAYLSLLFVELDKATIEAIINN